MQEYPSSSQRLPYSPRQVDPEVTEGGTDATSLAYWRHQLDNLTPLDLPIDRPRTAESSNLRAWSSFQIPALLASAIRDLSQQLDSTLFITLLAAFQTLLARYSGQEDIAIGTSVASEAQPDLETQRAVSSILVIRINLSGSPAFDELVRDVHNVYLSAYAHRDVAFERVVECVQPAHDLDCHPLFQVMFELQAPGESGQEDISDSVFESLIAKTDVPNIDLGLTLQERLDGGLDGKIIYSAHIFDSATIERLIGHFQVLLAACANDPTQPIMTLPLLTEDERKLVLVKWNATERSYPQDACIHDLIAMQAARTPGAVALIFEDRQLTYAELDARANQLARHLQGCGVGPNMRVGVCLERSIDLVVGLFAILKVGAAYVPLDPAYPGERLQFMLQDTNPAALLTTAALLSMLPEHTAQAVVLDQQAAAIAQQPATPLRIAVTPEHLAYVIYTSGSTGTPKGVMVPHRGVTRLLLGVDYARLDSTQTILHMAPISFDASTFEIWGALLHGGRCVLLPQRIPTPADIGQAIQKFGVSTLWLTASLFNTVIDEAPQVLKSVRQLLIGGEALSVNHVRRALALLPDTQIINGYGPTESTTFTCCYPIPQILEPQARSIPIGPPIANTTVYVLDRALQPVPIGVSGELYIGGAGLAHGYLNRPELTAERFIPHPFSTIPGARLYKTGDLARYLPDGRLDYLERIDRQVKLRGFRIELGEIESALALHEQVREVVVVVREDRSPADGQRHKRLVAYLATYEGPFSPSIGELRAFLQQRLPAYMIPSAFVLLDKFSLTPNGKLDRRALPAPAGIRPELGHAAVPPRNATEAAIVDVWMKILDITPIGIHDDFFALGGHSLLATQVITRLRDTFNIEISIPSLFAAPTVAELATLIEGIRQDERTLLVPSLQGIARTSTSLPLSFGQQRLWFFDQLTPHSAAYNLPVIVRLQGTLDIPALEHSLSAIIQRHESLRTIFTDHNGQPVQQIVPAQPVVVPIHEMNGLDNAAQLSALAEFISEEAQRPFDLRSGPLLRALLARLSARDHVLVLTVHHIVSDGWSQGLLLREITTLYPSFASRTSDLERPLLPELPVQYADYAVWQREWLAGSVLDEQIAYWKQQLANLALLDLPTDYPRPPVQSHQGAQHFFQLSPALTTALHALSQREGASLFMTLLAAFQTLLYRYTQQADIAVGAPIAGRTRPELEGLIGFFVNTLVLRADLSGSPSFREVLARVRHICLGAYAHQDLPFDMLVEHLQPARDLSRSPLFQVMLALQNAPSAELELPGISIAPMRTELGQSKFDLFVEFEEGASGLKGKIEYSTDLFAPATIARLAGHLQTLLAAVADEPSQCIDRLPLLTEAERQRMVVDWNTTAADYLLAPSLHQLVETQAARAPETTAVICEGQSLTYRELNERANQLAHQLRASGVGGCPQGDVRVGICLRRSVDLVIAVLGVLKAGGAYVPLDPAYPAQRLAFMLSDAQTRVVVTQQALLAILPSTTGTILCVDRDRLEIGQQPSTNPTIKIQPDHLAYVIYTSGSTGTPKGVMVAHRAVCNHLLWRQATYPLTSADRFLHKASFSFDISVWECFAPWLAGACLVMASDEEQQSVQDLAGLIARERVTVFHAGPALLSLLLEQPEITECRAVRHIFCGGEALSAMLRERCFALLKADVHHQYGPTEACIDATIWDCQRGIDEQVIPIGRPIANMRSYILDSQLQIVPPGVVGLLYLGGVGLARGYHNRPELTAEQFIPDPFGGHLEGTAGGRLYRTGDLARYRADGAIEFVGRIDHQVKVRGYRIELAEVEMVLQQHPAVQHAHVIAQQDAADDLRLAAYLVIHKQQAAPSVSELRSFMQERLPGYMVPGAFVQLDALPLTPNGKIDRSALPQPGSARPDLDKTFVGPRNPNETQLAAIWSKLLGVEQIGIDDNFFALGGHSLLLTRLASAIRATFRVELPLRQLFDTPTIAGMSKVILAKQLGQVKASDITRLLTQLKQLSPDEVKALLGKQGDRA